ncbi:MAG: tRNA (guanosine(37)-N1)-methyltransferase TrmD [Proteocatella sp.]
MNYHIMTLFPEFIDSATEHSIIKRAKENEIIDIKSYNIRDFSESKHKKVDDYPFGGGAGMVMGVQPIVDCHEHILSVNNLEKKQVRTIYMSPKGETLTQKKAEELASYENLIILCGHYEGVDQRAIDMIVEEEISIGDYILTGGELGALVIIDATARLIGGVLNKEESHMDESFSNNLLEYPQYTRPREYRGLEVPEVLLSGNHKLIEQWRFEKSLEVTKERRTDLLQKLDVKSLSKSDKKIYDKVLQK